MSTNYKLPGYTDAQLREIVEDATLEFIEPGSSPPKAAKPEGATAIAICDVYTEFYLQLFRVTPEELWVDAARFGLQDIDYILDELDAKVDE
jgi:hypothetical protein